MKLIIELDNIDQAIAVLGAIGATTETETPPKAKRARKADPVPEAPKADAPTPAPAVSSVTHLVDVEDLRKRFTRFVEGHYDKALAILQSIDCSNFKEVIAKNRLPELQAALNAEAA